MVGGDYALGLGHPEVGLRGGEKEEVVVLVVKI